MCLCWGALRVWVSVFASMCVSVCMCALARARVYVCVRALL